MPGDVGQCPVGRTPIRRGTLQCPTLGTDPVMDPFLPVQEKHLLGVFHRDHRRELREQVARQLPQAPVLAQGMLGLHDVMSRTITLKPSGSA